MRRAAPLTLLLTIVTPRVRAEIALPPGTSAVFINIGSNRDPILPPDDDASVSAIAIEPVVHHKIERRDRLFVVPAAVADEASITTMSIYNHTEGPYSGQSDDGQTSSLLGKPTPLNFGVRESLIVPVISMKSLLAGIGASITIWFLKTDMQGLDATTLRAGGELLQRVQYVTAEIYLLGIATYNGARNDYCTDLLPVMMRLGFEPVGLKANSGVWPHEIEALRDPHIPAPKTLGPHGHSGKTLFHARSAGNGTEAALAYCTREAAMMREPPPNSHDLPRAPRSQGEPPAKGLREADAYFRRIGTTMPPPPLHPRNADDWPVHQRMHQHEKGGGGGAARGASGQHRGHF